MLSLTLIFLPDTAFAWTEGKVSMTPQELAPVFKSAVNKLVNLFRNAKMVLLIIGGFGLICLAFQAIFGKVRWGWFSSLAFGLALVSAAGAVINYASNDRHAAEAADGSDFADTYKSSGSGIIVTDPSMETGGGITGGGASLSIE